METEEKKLLVVSKKFYPAYKIEGIEDGRQVCMYRILSYTKAHLDCAAYEIIGPPNADPFDIQKMKSIGTKMSEIEARKVFPTIETLGLKYRR